MQEVHSITRVTAPTSLPFAAAVAAFESMLDEWDVAVEAKLVGEQATWGEVVEYVDKVAGDIGLMRFHKVDQGAITSLSGQSKECALYLVGNPKTANGILDIDIRAALYVPFRVAILAPVAGGEAVLVYDQPSSSLATLDHPRLHAIGEGLDSRMSKLVQAMRASSNR
ncbi:protein of unknown function DUF302 [Luteibacter sp. UNCMF331Sha3.1]|uniref:DUF302 domain-containing protein n=1 Tax=Luteibacter sp. UNCMF331Sha3.1 TaxID=1502760 RepID=UPI0008B95A1A|nr:DUF302 domain-containing protein [Luteibacter sp. UNCMF331Sha3.1]SEN11501.1 protein of unknown function DUF302 [Luteibacter sp. UNCMF331Sha3.1]